MTLVASASVPGGVGDRTGVGKGVGILRIPMAILSLLAKRAPAGSHLLCARYEKVVLPLDVLLEWRHRHSSVGLQRERTLEKIVGIVARGEGRQAPGEIDRAKTVLLKVRPNGR